MEVRPVYVAPFTYFEANPQIERRFATDFEAYTGPESVAVHIGIV